MVGEHTAPSGESLEESKVTAFAWVALAVLCMVGPLAWALEKSMLKWTTRVRTRTHLPYWSVAVLAFSYGLLIPGLICSLFKYRIMAAGGSLTLKEGNESMLEFIHLLGSTGCWYGAALVALYAIAIPAVKLSLLITAEVLRMRPGQNPMIARICLAVVQLISKWASPDMFAYVLLMYLMRSLSHPPIVVTTGNLDTGFTCFALFCIFSTVASLGIKMPPAEARNPAPTNPMSKFHAPLRLALPWVALSLLAVFLVTFAIGINMTCMALRVNVDGFFEPTGTLPLDWKPFIEALHLEELVHAEVTLWGCLKTLAIWGIRLGDANDFLAFVLFAVFCCAFTVLDMILLTITALHTTFWPSVNSPTGKGVASNVPCKLLTCCRYLRKLAMLDVAIVGIVVVTLCGYVYREAGVILSLDWGLLWLAAAELAHDVLHCLVMFVEWIKPPADEPMKQVEALPPSDDQSSERTVSTV